MEGLGETLRTGDFVLVLAAPTIPPGVQRVIEYLNARGHSIFGLEVSYFVGEVEAFVPRVVVRPSLGSRIAGQDAHAAKPVMDPEAYIASLPDLIQHCVRSFSEDVQSLGGELQWLEYGVRVRVSGENGPKVVVYLNADGLWITVKPRTGLDAGASARATQRLGQIPGANVGASYGSVKWATATESQVSAALQVARDFVTDLVDRSNDVESRSL